ncbi:MAG TPA: SDR family oxidoreductase [Rhizomicrobium sp.]|jgi:NAD(P)-dependent dehydrogenase (short-subunit alcohol dehydrogenase family)|nr:SDR family oxidoreductase [Rhizomicrobium sp.]
MQGKTVVITGATSGIGEVAADRLALKGARIVFVARDPARGEETLKHLNAIAPGDHAVHYADLSRLSEMKRVAGEIAAAEPKIDVLINNAGALFNTRTVTEDGLESTFALNHMSYFVITNLLLDKLKATLGARIVSTASDAHKGNRLDFDDLQSAKSYTGFSVYGRSKLMNILFTRELSRRLSGSVIIANCLHPGFVATRFGHGSGGIVGSVVKVAQNFALTPEQGAQTIIYLASSPEVDGKSGGYYVKSKLATPTKEAQNDADAKRLWDISAQIAGLGA